MAMDSVYLHNMRRDMGVNINIDNIDPRNNPIANSLWGTAWQRYNPSFCIDNAGKVSIEWPQYVHNSDSRDTARALMNKYRTIFGGGHCLVYDSKPVFEDTPVRSRHGVAIADWRDLRNANNHHNAVIGGTNCRISRRRTFLGHHRDGYFLLVCVEGRLSGDQVIRTDHPPTTFGMNLQGGARLMADLGCDYAINMDGGTPVQMHTDGEWRLQVPTANPDEPTTMNVGVAICAYNIR